MNRLNLSCVIALGVFGALSSAHASDVSKGVEGNYALWGVGVTGWMCAQEPCPWRGVFSVAEDGTRGRPVDIENMPEPPPMRGDPDDIAHIETVYADHGCVLVEGRFNGNLLIVGRILGEC